MGLLFARETTSFLLPFISCPLYNHKSINMDFVNKFTGGDQQGQGQNQNQQQGQGRNEQSSSSSSGGGGFLGGIGDKLNSAAGGGKESEKNEDYIDKGVDFVQEKFMGAGPQDNESAVEQAKDEQI